MFIWNTFDLQAKTVVKNLSNLIENNELIDDQGCNLTI